MFGLKWGRLKFGFKEEQARVWAGSLGLGLRNCSMADLIGCIGFRFGLWANGL